MDSKLRAKLITIAKETIRNDLSHDFNHAFRVLNLAERIVQSERGADMDVIVPSALFHDLVVYKGTSRHAKENHVSAVRASKILKGLGYSKEKIDQVFYSISVTSFSKNVTPQTLEAKIVEDADLLEASGAVVIMRTFGSAIVMHNRAYYDSSDPFCRERKPDASLYSLDLFFTRLLIIQQRLHTNAAKNLAKKRTVFLKVFLEELQRELRESGLSADL